MLSGPHRWSSTESTYSADEQDQALAHKGRGYSGTEDRCLGWHTAPCGWREDGDTSCTSLLEWC